MEFIEVEQNLDKHSYFLADEVAHFHRFCDGGFKTKWCGFWVYDQKFLDYFALKVNGKWLPNPRKVTYDGDKCMAEYDCGGLKVRETVYLKGRNLFVDMKADKDVDLEVEMAVNIKDVSEDYHRRTYQVVNKKDLEISSEAGKLVFSAKNYMFQRDPHYKEHYKDVQRAFLPGKVLLKGRKARLKFSGFLRSKTPSNNHHTTSKKGVLKGALSEEFEWCCKDMDLVWKSFEDLGGLVAGYPYFLQFWGRDSLWSVPALVDMGDFKRARTVLRLFLHKSREGIIDQMINLKGEAHFKALDTNALWILALDHYLKYSRDKQFLEREHGIEKVLEVIKRELEEPTQGFTWMDTIDRPGAVDVAALNIRALEVAKDRGLVKAGVRRLKKEFEDTYWNPETNYYRDNLKTDALTCNPLVAVMLDVADKKQEVLEKVRNEFTNQGGVRTRSPSDPGYQADGYHTGMVWGLTTGWAACCEFAYGDPEIGWQHLKFLSSDLKKNCLGAINEAWDGDSLSPNPGLFQTWSSALFVRAIDEYMLGMDVEKGKLTCKPKLPSEVKELTRKKRLGKKWLSVKISKEEGYHVELH